MSVDVCHLAATKTWCFMHADFSFLPCFFLFSENYSFPEEFDSPQRQPYGTPYEEMVLSSFAREQLLQQQGRDEQSKIRELLFFSARAKGSALTNLSNLSGVKVYETRIVLRNCKPINSWMHATKPIPLNRPSGLSDYHLGGQAG